MMNNPMLNGFAGVNQNISNGFMNAELSRCNQQAALMQQLNAMQMQAKECLKKIWGKIRGVSEVFAHLSFHKTVGTCAA